MQGLSQLLGGLHSPNSRAAVDADALLDQAYHAIASMTGPLAPVAQLDDIKFTCLFHDTYKHFDLLRNSPQMLIRSAGDVSTILLEASAGSLHSLKGRGGICCITSRASSHSRPQHSPHPVPQESRFSSLHGCSTV